MRPSLHSLVNLDNVRMLKSGKPRLDSESVQLVRWRDRSAPSWGDHPVRRPAEP